MVSVNMISMQSEDKQFLPFPNEISVHIIEQKYKRAIENWTDIFSEPKINLQDFIGVRGASKELKASVDHALGSLKKLKQERYNQLFKELKANAEKEYKKRSTDDLNKDLINILDKNLNAISKDNLKTAVNLILAGANVNTTVDHNKSAVGFPLEISSLLLAVSRGYYEIAKVLISAGADVNFEGIHGNTPLMLASSNGYESIVKLLLDNRADVNKRSRIGSTALMNAASAGYVNIVKMLLDKNADVNVKNNLGDTALMLAQKNGHENIAEILKSVEVKQ